MIVVTCRHCQAKLKAKAELAGRNVRCPRCKTVVGIPHLPTDDTTLPPHPGAAVSEDLTATSSSASVSSQDEPLTTEGHIRIQTEIARGGMGAIMRAVDEDIEREVAVKFLLNPADERHKARFVEEAKITGQLEHPNIVPIHQLGAHADGRCYFSMKMVKGRSLAEILKDTESTYTLNRLLTIFVSICNGMAYAHSRRVIHRDLKPANIMVGDFGEVYVMDWGLAKVLDRDDPTTTTSDSHDSSGASKAGENAAHPKSEDRSATKLLSVGDLTQAGAIMGTPAYMPPEQASGEPVDERADIFALGALLYEIMTLTPPPNRGGDMVAILIRVVEGKIDPPEVRAPARVEAGWISPELSAIAMKAMARKREDRYQSVAALRRDIELFAEGRSVSAKRDTAWEMTKKFVKRNLAVSIALAGALTILLVVVSVFMIINYRARVTAENHFNAYRDQVKKSLPAFVEAARLAVNRRQYDESLDQLKLALEADPDHAAAILLKGQVMLVRHDFAQAEQFLHRYLQSSPHDLDAQRLIELCRKPHPDDPANLILFAQVFLKKQQTTPLADGILAKLGPNALEARKTLLTVYRERIKAVWPGSEKNLILDGSGGFSLQVQGKEFDNLAVLQGMPLVTLKLLGSEVRDLTPLKGMPLQILSLYNCSRVEDLAPLQGMKLTDLDIAYVSARDLTSLKGMPLKRLNLNYCDFSRDLSPLRGMPLDWLNMMNSAGPCDLSPLEGMDLKYINLPKSGFNTKNIEVLRSMNNLATIQGPAGGSGSAEEFWKKYDEWRAMKK